MEVVVGSYSSGISTLEEEVIDDEVVCSYGTGISLLVDKLVVVVVVVVGP